MEAWTPKRAKYFAKKFSGVATVQDICELAGTEEYVLRRSSEGWEVLEIAGMTLKYQDVLIKAPDGSLDIITVGDLRENFEVME